MVKSKSKSNKVGGWLLFFAIVFLLSGVGEVYLFFSTLSGGANNTQELMQLLFAPLLALELFVSASLIFSMKKSALQVVYITLGTMAVAGIINNIVAGDGVDNGLRFIGFVTGPAIYAAWALYFKQSVRVKKTLVK
ncbi:MAG: hypothetical protein H6797_01755 [Candidatus Nomurabacteria bacterium]|nr:MAG: hypothetical protein H6797_01755 [Candidatus Nomurabacteria bacterium]